jgi:hypothetical protein
MPKTASTAADDADAGTAAHMHSASTDMHCAAADVHSAPTAASATMTSAAMTAAASQKRGRRQKQAGGYGADKKRGTRHDDPPLEA